MVLEEISPVKYSLCDEGLDVMNPQPKDIGKRVIFIETTGKIRRYEVAQDKRYNDSAIYKRLFWWRK